MPKHNAKRTFMTCLMAAGLLVLGCGPGVAPTPTPASPAPKTAAPTAKPAPATAVPAAATVAPKPAAPKPAAPAATPKPAAERPRYGGIVTRVMDRDLDHFDLQQGRTAPFSQVLFNVYQGLVRIDHLDHKTIRPELAEKWEVSPDGKTYTFTLYKSIKWHDGKPFTTDDILYSLDRIKNPKKYKAISPRGEGLIVALDNAEAAGADTIKLSTKYPSASFLLNIATGWVAVQPKHILEAKGDMKKDCVGTGPFKFKSKNPGVSLELVKNPDYHVKGLPYLDGIKFFTIADTATRFSAFRTGQVLITFSGSKGLTPAHTEIVKKEMADKAVAYDHDSQMRYSIVFNQNKKPWSDVRVRRAVDLVFDRQAAIKVNGKGNIGSLYVAPWGMKSAELAKLPGYRQPKDADVAQAKQFMAEAGYADGFKTTLLCRSGGASAPQGVVAKDQLAKIGIDAEVIVKGTPEVADRFVRRAFDLVSYGFLDTTGDPDETLFTYYYTKGSSNYGDFSDKEIDALIEKQARTLDGKAREAILAEIERKSLELVPMAICFWDVYQTGAWKIVKDWRPGPGIHPWGKFDQMWLA
ncbi:MAG: ABC transporter substrate-binding protein, partial [Chloroflexota bacterium]